MPWYWTNPTNGRNSCVVGRRGSPLDSSGYLVGGNLRHLQRAGGHPSAGERMWAGMDSVEEALSRHSRYRTLKENLEIEGIMVSDREVPALYGWQETHWRPNTTGATASVPRCPQGEDPGSQIYGGRASLEGSMRTHGKPQVRKAPGSGR